jgi:apolipoprotein N-acyltransferase
VQARSGVTPYAWWGSRVGLWPYLACAALVLLLVRLAPR